MLVVCLFVWPVATYCAVLLDGAWQPDPKSAVALAASTDLLQHEPGRLILPLILQVMAHLQASTQWHSGFGINNFENSAGCGDCASLSIRGVAERSKTCWLVGPEACLLFGREVLKARWCEPTLSVVDVRIGDEDGSGDSAYRFGPTRFSVIPRSAVGNVSIRFVPDQNADLLIAALRSALHLNIEFFVAFDELAGAERVVCLHRKLSGAFLRGMLMWPCTTFQYSILQVHLAGSIVLNATI